jgi:hypothetical protein
MTTPEAPKRVPVDYRFDAINPLFLKWMARIGSYADKKYGAWEQYTKARLTGEKSPVNHMQEHLRSFMTGELYDHFDGDVRWHLVAIAYNCMMEFYYVTKWGFTPHPLTVDSVAPDIPKRATMPFHDGEGLVGSSSRDRSQGSSPDGEIAPGAGNHRTGATEGPSA